MKRLQFNNSNLRSELTAGCALARDVRAHTTRGAAARRRGRSPGWMRGPGPRDETTRSVSCSVRGVPRGRDHSLRCRRSMRRTRWSRCRDPRPAGPGPRLDPDLRPRHLRWLRPSATWSRDRVARAWPSSPRSRGFDDRRNRTRGARFAARGAMKRLFNNNNNNLRSEVAAGRARAPDARGQTTRGAAAAGGEAGVLVGCAGRDRATRRPAVSRARYGAGRDRATRRPPVSRARYGEVEPRETS